jgi:hypothetical protein
MALKNATHEYIMLGAIIRIWTSNDINRVIYVAKGDKSKVNKPE